MQIYRYPDKNSWQKISKRPVIKQAQLDDLMKDIFNRVRCEGDKALYSYTLMFDGVELSSLRINPEDFNNCDNYLSDELKESIKIAAQNIYTFHKKQKEETFKVETTEGVICWQKSIPIEKVGLYIPGGSAPLFSSVLMLAVPANIAGCKDVILVTPPNKEGKIHPAILYAAKISGIKPENIFNIGGAQAVAALTLGTETIPQVYKIFGPGNQYVTAAKQYATYYGVGFDLPAGPSEVLIIADENADPSFIATDLLSQAEHGTDSQVILTCTNEKLINAVIEELEKQLMVLPRREIAEKSLENSKILLFQNLNDCVEFSNVYAPEHLILCVDEANYFLTDYVINAGSVFIGYYTPESAGDYATGTNHTLPTNGYAYSYSGVSVESFTKKVFFQKISEKGLKNLGNKIEIMAEAEGLQAHKNAVTVRLHKLNS